MIPSCSAHSRWPRAWVAHEIVCDLRFALAYVDFADLQPGIFAIQASVLPCPSL